MRSIAMTFQMPSQLSDALGIEARLSSAIIGRGPCFVNSEDNRISRPLFRRSLESHSVRRLSRRASRKSTLRNSRTWESLQPHPKLLAASLPILAELTAAKVRRRKIRVRVLTED